MDHMMTSMDHMMNEGPSPSVKRVSMDPMLWTGNMDPALWSTLAPDILDVILSKFSFPRLAELRLVCKDWCFNIIPRVTIQFQVVRRHVLLYFGCGRLTGSACWLRIHEEFGRDYGELEALDSSFRCGVQLQSHREYDGSFPSAGVGEELVLMASQGGLLFFAFTFIKTGKVRAILSCNPLTAKFKVLKVPSPLMPLDDLTKCPKSPAGKILVGVMMDQTTGRAYTLVVAGIDEENRCWTFMYHSSTCSWKKIDASAMTSLLEYGANINRKFMTGRSVCAHGNLYWTCSFVGWCNFVLKFCFQSEQWCVIPVQPPIDSLTPRLHIAPYGEDLVVWEAQVSRSHPDHVHFYPVSYGLDGGFGLDHPEVKMMPQRMMKGKAIYACGASCGWDDYFAYLARPLDMRTYTNQRDYSGFSEGRLFYHVIHVGRKGRWGNVRLKRHLKIIVHDAEDDRYHLLPEVDVKSFRGRGEPIESLWTYTGSMISTP